MSVTVKSKIRRKRRVVLPKTKKGVRFRKKKNPVELFGIWKDKIFFDENEFLTSRY
jgi:hypothetical protein